MGRETCGCEACDAERRRDKWRARAELAEQRLAETTRALDAEQAAHAETRKALAAEKTANAAALGESLAEVKRLLRDNSYLASALASREADTAASARNANDARNEAARATATVRDLVRQRDEVQAEATKLFSAVEGVRYVRGRMMAGEYDTLAQVAEDLKQYVGAMYSGTAPDSDATVEPVEKGEQPGGVLVMRPDGRPTVILDVLCQPSPAGSVVLPTGAEAPRPATLDDLAAMERRVLLAVAEAAEVANTGHGSATAYTIASVLRARAGQ